MAATVTAFEAEILGFTPSERGLMAGAACRLKDAYARGHTDPTAHNLALAVPEYVDALARNGKTASFAAITAL
jgi:hypothetical protein